MERIPFDKKELIPIGEIPSFFPGMPPRPIYNTPVTPRENYLALMSGETPLWMPGFSDTTMMTVNLAENVSRGFVFEAEGIDNNTQAGGPDFFGVEWEYVPSVGGSMVRGGNPKIPDIEHWEDYITFPDLDKVMDWEACRDRNSKGFIDRNKVLDITILTGLFERLISFMDFENAAYALVDEDQQEGVHRLFDRLADFYDEYIDYYHRYLNPDMITFHDDWGSQRAPFFSLDVCMEMVAPYLKRIADHCHEKGLWFQQHCCGKNELLVPAMVYAGVDMWMPQVMNDVEKLREQYGDKIMFSIAPPQTERDATDKEIEAAADAFVGKFAADYQQKPFIVGSFFADPRFTTAIYKYSRLALGK